MGLFDIFKVQKRSVSPLPPMPYAGGSYFTFSELEANTTATACTNVIAKSIAILPVNMYFRDPKTGERKRAGWHRLHTMLKRRPNTTETPVQFFMRLMMHILQRGNAYIFLSRDSSGEVKSMYLLNPQYVDEVHTGIETSYKYNGNVYTSRDILHIPSLITDDYGHGKAPVDLAKAAIRLGIQYDKASESAFGNGMNSKLIVDIKEALKDVNDPTQAIKIAREYADYIARNYAGPENAGKPLIKLNGMELTELKGQYSNKDDELLESRKWQEREICKAFGVPPWMVNGTFDVSYGGLEQAMIAYINLGLMPYLRHLEQKFNTLLTEYEQDAYYFEFDFNVLLRADAKSRTDTYRNLFNVGAISPDEIAAKENLEASKDGAGMTRFVPAQNMPVRNDVFDAYMSKAKAAASGLVDAPDDPARAAGDDKL